MIVSGYVHHAGFGQSASAKLGLMYGYISSICFVRQDLVGAF
jgi:hypothetical protein